MRDEYLSQAELLAAKAAYVTSEVNMDAIKGLVNSDALIWWLALDTFRTENGDLSIDDFAVSEYLTQELRAYKFDDGEMEAAAMFVMLKAESTREHTEYRIQGRREFYGMDSSYTTHFDALGMVYNNPERLPYAVVGLRDASFIDKCIADDIDAEMAVRL